MKDCWSFVAGRRSVVKKEPWIRRGVGFFLAPLFWSFLLSLCRVLLDMMSGSKLASQRLAGIGAGRVFRVCRETTTGWWIFRWNGNDLVPRRWLFHAWVPIYIKRSSSRAEPSNTLVRDIVQYIAPVMYRESGTMSPEHTGEITWKIMRAQLRIDFKIMNKIWNKNDDLHFSRDLIKLAWWTHFFSSAIFHSILSF